MILYKQRLTFLLTMFLIFLTFSTYGHDLFFFKVTIEDRIKEKSEDDTEKKVGGWYFNLGITGARAKLYRDRKSFEVTYVFEDTPADKKLKIGDVIFGANGKEFETVYTEEYGEDGPLIDFGNALEESQGPKAKGLDLAVMREGEKINVNLKISKQFGQFGKDFPYDCPKVDKILEELYAFLLSRQKSNGSWGAFHNTTFTILALLASGNSKYLPAAEKGIRSLLNDRSTWLPAWKSSFSGIVLGEYYLKTKEKWVLPELEKVQDKLLELQYSQLSQRNATKEKMAKVYGQPATQKHNHLRLGGWSHDPGWTGYGPMAITTGQATLALSLMSRCGVNVDMTRLKAGYDFLDRSTNGVGNVYYHDDAKKTSKEGGPLGRTGITALANFVCPISDDIYLERAKLNISCLKVHYKGLAHSHASSALGIAWAMAGASLDNESYKVLLDQHKWFINLAHCPNGSFYCQPNKDYVEGAADYVKTPHLSMSAALAFGLTIRNKELSMTMRTQGFRLPQIKMASAEIPKKYQSMYKNVLSEKLNYVYKDIVRYQKKPELANEDKVLIEKLDEHISNATEKLIGHINGFDEMGDYYKVQSLMLLYKRTFAGIPDFDEKFSILEKKFKGKEEKKIILIGKAFYYLVKRLNENKKKDREYLLSSYEKFINKYPDNIYSDACKEIMNVIEKFPTTKVYPEQFIQQVRE